MAWGELYFYNMGPIPRFTFSFPQDYMKFVCIKIPKVIGILITFHLVCIGWIFFRAQNIHLAWRILSYSLDIRTPGSINISTAINLAFFTLPLLILQIFERRFSIKQNFIAFNFIFKLAFVIVAILSIISFGVMGNEFIYFEF